MDLYNYWGMQDSEGIVIFFFITSEMTFTLENLMSQGLQVSIQP